MKLEKYENKSMSKRKVLLIGLGIIMIISVSLFLYKNNNLKVKNDDVYFAFYNGNEKLESMPLKDNEENLVFDYGVCDNGAYVEWDNDNWGPLVKNLSKSKTKCSLYFRKYSGIDFIKNLETATNGDGLYLVSHNVNEINKGWNQKEYRYAGVDSNNYVSFNNEIWRVIGVVNVKTDNGIEQRIKIIRTNGINNQKDFGIYYWDKFINNWTASKLKDMLNGIYYESKIGDCYISNTPSECDFTSGVDLPKGLDDTARNMIAKEVIWNLGGWNNSELTASQFYEKERGKSTGNSNTYPSEWSSTTDEGEKHNGIGLIYPSDYGYATNGGSIGRETCFAKELYNWSSTSGNYKSECGGTDWLKPSSGNLWTIFPNSSDLSVVFRVMASGTVYTNYVYDALSVWPTLYLKKSIEILPNPHSEQEYGSLDNPFILSQN